MRIEQLMSVSQILSDRSPRGATTPLLAWLTIERALYGLLACLGAGLRLGWLHTQPLNTLEAGHAWSAWLAVNGSGSSFGPAPDSPLLYTVHTLLFWLFGPGDGMARLIPALCGVGAIILLWYWRAWLGPITTLLAAVLLTIDPWLTADSRLADSAMLSILLALLTITGLMQVAAPWENPTTATAHSGWRTTTALSFGLLLVSGPQAWSLLVVVLLFAWFCLSGDYVQAWLREARWWTVVAGAAVLGATGWLVRPEGLGALSTSFTVWLQQITGSGLTEPYTLGWLGWRLLLEQPLLVIFGLGGLALYWSSYRRQASSGEPTLYDPAWMRFLTAWFLWGLLLVLLPGRTPLALAMVSLPLLFWAAHGLTLLLQQAHEGVAWRENSLLMAILAILLTSFAIWLAALTTNTTFDGTLARTLLIIWVLVFLIILAYTLWLDGRQARLTTGVLLAMSLLAWTVSNNWQLNQRFDVAFPDGFFAAYTNPDVRQLAANVQMLSAQRRGDPGELPVQVEMVGTPDPVLGWYLREMRNLTWVLAPGLVDGQSPPLVITLSEDSAAVNQLASTYLGSRYALRDHWLPATLTANEVPAGSPAAELGFGARLQERLNTLWTARWRGLLRWGLYREAPATPLTDTVILWVMAEAPQP